MFLFSFINFVTGVPKVEHVLALLLLTKNCRIAMQGAQISKILIIQRPIRALKEFRTAIVFAPHKFLVIQQVNSFIITLHQHKRLLSNPLPGHSKECKHITGKSTANDSKQRYTDTPGLGVLCFVLKLIESLLSRHIFWCYSTGVMAETLVTSV